MTRLAFGAFGANSIEADGMTAVNAPAVVASPFTGGGPYALRCVGAAGAVYATYPVTIVSDRAYFLRSRFRISASPNQNMLLMGFGVPAATAVNFGLALVSGSLDIRIWGSGNVRDVAGPTLVVDTDYLLEVEVIYSTAGSETITGRLNGTQFATVTQAFVSTQPTTAFFGLTAGASCTTHYTDWALNDDQGANNNSWPGDARVAMLLPVSDDTGNSTISADAWRLINSGTTNLYTGVDNTPPTGIATPGSGTSQIVCDTPSTMRAYTAVTETYTSKIAAGDTVTHVQALCGNAESISTGTKTGTILTLANPAGSGAAFTYGDAGGAAGTWPTNWVVNRSDLLLAPSVTRGTGASVQVQCVTSTRNVDVCFMGVYVEYTLAVAAGMVHRGLLLGVGT
jgi:hypothetical protein